MRKYITVIAAAAIFVSLYSYTLGSEYSRPPADKSGKTVISFDFDKQSGRASNQFAVWVEDEGGKLVKTLYATRFTAKGGYKNRPDSIPLWVEKSGLASMNQSEIDVISGATPQAGTLYYVWDLTDKDANKVAPGKYRFFVEGSTRWKNRVLYAGVITIGGGQDTVSATAQFFFEASDNQPALSENAPENSMIKKVSATFAPEKKVLSMCLR
jgi:hypothetical protein